MKRLCTIALCMSILSTGMAQLKAKVKCPDFYVDVLNGTVNDIKPSYTPNEIKEKFPCFTGEEEEGGTAKCGGGIYFKDKDIFFYTKRDYVEVGSKFLGKTSIPLLGTKRGSLFRTLGNPKIKDDTRDAFEMQYGTLVLHYDAAGKVKFFQFSTFGTDQLNLCE
ncbi:hypothetical protein ACQ86N_42495 [Puia sp. P3]|uniref:hypothetical protein n=1 Tax=Puia sp. P3 TaxID=3423952 RepID=UPI003D670122